MPAPKGHPPYKGCETGGRPLKYTEEIINGYADELTKWMKYPSSIFLDEFAIEKGILPCHMSRWAEKNEKFCHALKLARYSQETKIKKGALHKVYSDGFAKFLLINNHGVNPYSDKTEQKVTASMDSPVTFIMNIVSGTSKDLVNDKIYDEEADIGIGDDDTVFE